VGRSRKNSHCSYVSAVPLPQEPLLIKGPCDLPLLLRVSLDGGGDRTQSDFGGCATYLSPDTIKDIIEARTRYERIRECPLPSNAALEGVLPLPSPVQVAIRSCFACKVPDSWLTTSGELLYTR
ncbi:ATP synthase epsilon chain, partial [Striga asiatica]